MQSFASPVLLISVDGLKADVTTGADINLNIPTLRRFLTEGSHAEGVVGVTPTVTYPSHTTLVTGVTPAEHGIYANGPFDPRERNGGGWYWYASDVKVMTLWQAADKAGLITASVDWPATAGALGIRYNLPEFGLHTTDHLKMQEVVARPDGLLTSLEAALGPYTDDGTEEGDRIRVRFAIEILKRYRPQFMTVHLLAVDHRSHEGGPFSAEAQRAIEAVDSSIAELRSAMLANDPDAVVAVVSDHGFMPIQREFNVLIPFVKAGLITLAKPATPDESLTVSSWRASVWNAGGSAAVVLKDPRDASCLAEVGALLKKLEADPRHGIARILGAHEVNQLGGWPAASFVIDMRPGYFLGGEYSGLEMQSFPTGGQHGYLPAHPEMNAAFLIMGRGIAKGRDLGVIDMRQIAPTLAKLLGLSLPAASEAALSVELTQ